MEHNDQETNRLLESIRNELVSIIEDENDIEEEKYGKSEFFKKNNKNNPVLSCAAGDASVFYEQSKTHTLESPYTKLRDGWVEPHCFKTIDGDIQKMYVNLRESYDLFQTIGQRFEVLNFGCLQTRIKDLHLTENKSKTIKTVVNDLKNSFDQRFMENGLKDLTSAVKSEFHKNSGEIKEIPELSEFFRACNQLQQGLERLKKDRRSVQELTTRMSQAADLSFSHLNEMQNMFQEKKTLSEFNKDKKNK